MLDVAKLSAVYGKHRALSEVDLSVDRGEIVVILGANGAGKTTLLKVIGGLLAPLPGATVVLDGRDLAAKSPHAIVEAGIALVPEGRGIFSALTVRENLMLGAYPKRARAKEAANLDLILDMFPKLRERMKQAVRTMSGGEQQMVAIGRALMTSPDILLLDEPSLGLSPIMCGELFGVLRRVRDAGVGVLLVEQNAKQSLNIADRGYLIETGRIVGQGPAAALKNDPAVQRAYLGGAAPAVLPRDLPVVAVASLPAIAEVIELWPGRGKTQPEPEKETPVSFEEKPAEPNDAAHMPPRDMAARLWTDTRPSETAAIEPNVTEPEPQDLIAIVPTDTPNIQPHVESQNAAPALTKAIDGEMPPMADVPAPESLVSDSPPDIAADTASIPNAQTSGVSPADSSSSETAFAPVAAHSDNAPQGADYRAKETTMLHVNLMIGDRNVSAADGRTFERFDPMTGEIASLAAAATITDAVAAADAAAAAFPAWAALGPSERRAKLLAAAEVLESRADDFAETMMSEIGATAPWGHFNVHLAAGMLREAASLTTQIKGETIPSDKPGSFAMSIRQPAGVVLGIAPWNAPVILGVRAIATPLACGNTVILKASEMCPATHRLIGTALRDSGLPNGVVNVVTNAPADAGKVVETLIAHPAVRRVNFTGSTRVGRIVAETAARYLKPVLLELGGKAPLVILDDADIDEAVKAAAFGAFANQGQICMSTERIVIDEKVADEFLEKFTAKAKSLPFGDPRTGKVVLGSLVNKEAALHVRSLIDDALALGGRLVTGGDVDGTVMPASIVDGVTPQMRLYSEESFGPVVSIIRVNGTERAIEVANDTEYGLSAAVFGRDIARALEVAKRIQSGICHINAPTVHDEAQMPFGGTKSSGYGRFGGLAAIDEFTELRWITIQTGPHHYPF
jgi:acyl-CoA reductase-like NAD-dependent aldehyde dehydrogenase/ABC-type branched-subunit amino acid transport system ATPase component